MAYLYNGKGKSFIPGVPARDISESEFAGLSEHEQELVLKSGLYTEVAPEKQKEKKEMESK